MSVVIPINAHVQMVWEQGVCVIVMLTPLHDMGLVSGRGGAWPVRGLIPSPYYRVKPLNIGQAIKWWYTVITRWVWHWLINGCGIG